MRKIPKSNIYWSKRAIIKYVKSIPNDMITSFFNVIYHGTSYAGNRKKKTPTRISILIPKEMANDNLKFMNEWSFKIIGIKVKNK